MKFIDTQNNKKNQNVFFKFFCIKKNTTLLIKEGTTMFIATETGENIFSSERAAQVASKIKNKAKENKTPIRILQNTLNMICSHDA
jgi:hypothetical protein